MKKKGLALIFVFVFVLSGCHNVRKKFVRKKKKEKEQAVYVNFKEYAKPSSYQLYQDYYLYATGWIDEILKSLEPPINFKRASKSFDELIYTLSQINSIFTDEGKESFSSLYNQVIDIDKEIKPLLNEIKRRAIVKDLEYIKRRINREFTISKVEQWIK